MERCYVRIRFPIIRLFDRIVCFRIPNKIIEPCANYGIAGKLESETVVCHDRKLLRLVCVCFLYRRSVRVSWYVPQYIAQ